MIEVTVLLVVHNCETYIKECIESILCQSYTAFELLIVNDGSTDNTPTVIKQFKDYRIRLIDNPCNDYIVSLNMGLEQAKGEYIARMDGDDVMLPERLERQVKIMNVRKDIAVCTSWCKCFGSCDDIIGRESGFISTPLVYMLKGNFIAHPATMLRKSFLVENKLVYRDYKFAEDYKLWSEIAIKGGNIWVIPEVLLKYRCPTHQISYKKQEHQAETSLLIKSEILNYLVEYYSRRDQSITTLYESLFSFNERGMLPADLIFDVFYEIFYHQ